MHNYITHNIDVLLVQISRLLESCKWKIFLYMHDIKFQGYTSIGESHILYLPM